jgi:tRNA A-37 threonylcarbamoyl transferase component Bud32
MSNKSSNELFNDPNKYARPLRIENNEHNLIFHGYQEFVLNRETLLVLDEDINLIKKRSLLKDYFSPHYLANRSFLDLGANAGFFSFWALQNKASKAYSLDIDQDYLDAIQQGKEKFSFHSLEVINTNIADWDQPCDVVLALALVHWIYSCTALYGSLEAVIKKLADLTNYMLIVEWIDPKDPAIDFFNHIQWNSENIQEPYTFFAFTKALSKYFKRFECVGDISETRKIFVAFKTDYIIDLSVPFKLIEPMENLISSRMLTSIEGIDYWSCVFDLKNSIIKQATLNLAEREALFLREFNTEHFPKVYDSWSENSYSVVTIEKIKGQPIQNIIADIRQDTHKMNEFVEDALSILELLRSKCMRHRDIRFDNLLYRNEKLVLIDFGWAETFESKIFTPPPLGGDERAPDGNHCDIYSMGKAIENVNGESFDNISQLGSLMTNPDPALRITNLAHLRLIWSVLKSNQ